MTSLCENIVHAIAKLKLNCSFVRDFIACLCEKLQFSWCQLMEKRGKVVRALFNFSSLCQTNAQSGSDYACLCFHLAVCGRSHLFVSFFATLFNYWYIYKTLCVGIKRWNSLAPHFKMVSYGQRILLFQVFLFLQGDIVCGVEGISLSSDDVRW